MNNSESGMAKKNIVVRFLAFSLAAIMMLGAFAVVPVLSVESEPEAEQSQSAQNNSEIVYDEDVLSITVDGEERTELEIYENEKVTIKAEGVLAAKYQWQILHPEKSGLWVDIYEETKETLDVSLALTGNMEQEDGKTYLRCLAYEADGAYVTDVLSVKELEGSKPIEAPQLPALKVETMNPNLVNADGDETPEFVTVTIKYEKHGYFYNVNTSKYELQYIAPAFSSYIATLQYGKQFKPAEPISVPTVVGYKPIFEGIDGITMVDGKINANIASVTSDITLEVRYVPDTVSFEVRYLFQNIYDDMYVTDTTINDNDRGIVNGIYHGEGITGLPPSYKIDADGNPYDSDEKVGISAEFAGFTALYYQPDTIAADGSTVFEVYFERNYYLMEFDCDGGYGAHTIYARHGTYIYVPAPAKMGYVLKKDANGNYWDLVTTGDLGNVADKSKPVTDKNGKVIAYNVADGTADALPAEMPKYNTSYKVLWDTTNTTYTVVYWIDNGDGTNTYIGSRPVDAMSATTVHGTDDLTTSMDICGLEAHTHNSDCKYSCNKTEHTHGDGSCTCPVVPHTHDGVSCDYSDCDESSGVVDPSHTHDITCYNPSNTNYKVANNSNSGYRYTISRINNPETGYIYKYCAGSAYHNYFYDGSKWYYLGSGKEYCGLLNGNMDESSSIGSYTYAPTTQSISCGKSNHTHDSSCCSVDTHTHDATCCTKSPHNHATSGCRLSCGKEEHAHSANCKYSDVAYLNYLDAKTDKNVVVEGDGSSVVNVYYEYKTYKFKFYYAKEENSNYYVCGNTTAFANGTANNIVNQLSQVSGNWGQVKKLPTLTDTDDIDVSELYTLGYDELTVGTQKGKYYYFTISFKYNEDISKKWPVGIFDSAELSSTYRFGDYAYFSAWNVDSTTWYDETYGNKTLKGNYQRLDYKLLIENDPNDTELNYLAFWENATMTVTWNKPHQWTYNVYIPDANGTYQRPNDMTYRVESGQSLPDSSTKYSLYGSYKVYDNNGASSGSAYCEQTPTALEGYELCFYGVKDLGAYDTKYDLHNYQIDFYYVANGPYQLSMYNYNAVMSDQGSDNLYFGTSLSPYEISEADMRNLYYPKGIEPGAYEFGGWYTTPACYEGTEVNWNTITMPDGNLTLYAKWTPIKRNVYFHLLYTDINYDDLENSNFWYPDGVSDAEKEDYYPIEVEHGSLLATTYSHTPTRVVNGEEYTFIGWFYFDENGKKKFAPDSMKVTRDLILFAEWFTTEVTTYKVEYMAYKYVDGGAGDELIDDEIAMMLNDYSTAGKTITFNAKGGTAMYDYSSTGGRNYQKKWFPHTSSHSILMDEDASKNTFYFKYYNKDYINYKVVYVNRINGDILGESEVIPTENAIVTPKFKPFEGYIPEDYYIEHSVAFDPTDYTEPGKENYVSDENIVYFYYVPDEHHALHRFEHHYQNVYDDGYTLYTAEQGPHEINEEKTAEVIRETGFQVVKVEITTYELVEGNWIPSTETITVTDANREEIRANGITRTVTLGGLDIRFYYDRIEYAYTVKYVEDVNNANVLAINPKNDVTYKARYGATVSFTAHATYLNEGDAGDDGLLYIYQEGADSTDDERTKTRQISEDESKNTLVFVYAKKKLLVMYHIITTVPALGQLNGVSLSSEYAASYTELLGANAMAGKGFEFEGWFKDEACTKPVDPAWVTGGTLLKPLELVDNFDGVDDDTIHYYAKFEPLYGSLTIIKHQIDGAAAAPVAPTESFLFHVKGLDNNNKHIDMVVTITDAGSKTINKIPIGDYEVTEMGDWSWTFASPNGDLIELPTVIEGETAEAHFYKIEPYSDWLTGEDIDEAENNKN